ncbi:MAG: response regulator [Chloroflexota bacterium]
MTRPTTILLVEDDRSLLNGISDLLELAHIGYEIRVITAETGVAALAAMADQLPDLIISDIMMPMMNGLELLGRVRQNPEWMNIPFIFLTAKGAKQDIREGRMSGADLYITKPFSSSDLVELVKTQLDRKFQIEQAHQQNLDNLKRNLLQVINHEFRTPLTFVTAYVDMLSSGLQSSEDSQNLSEYLRGIRVGCLRLTRLINDLVMVMELRTGEAAAHYEQRAGLQTHLGRLVAEVAEAHQKGAAEQGIQLTWSAADHLPLVYGDEEYLREALERLLDNAIKFTYMRRHLGEESPGRVQLSAEAADGELRLLVSDNGIGFPERVKELIFELFYQYNRERMEQQGPGCGLTIVKGLVELQGGRVEVQSKEGIGSVFTIVLPMVAANRPVFRPVASGRHQRKPATILLVEDDRYLLDGLQELLEVSDGKYEFRVLTAINGRKALSVLAEHRPDLIISDIMMPQMDGFALLGEVRRNLALLHIPFVFLTAKGEKFDIQTGLRSGAEEYIVKPYDSDELLGVVSNQLDRYFQRQGTFSQNFAELKRSILEVLRPEMKTPLAAISGYTENLAQGLRDTQNEADLTQQLRGIQLSSNRLANLTEDLLGLVELKTGEAQAAFQHRASPHSDPAALLQEASYFCQEEAQTMGVEFSWETAGPLAAIYCDSANLVNVLRRLIQLGLRLGQRAGERQLFLGTRLTDQGVQFAIQCAAAGFNEDEQARIQALLDHGDQGVLQLADYGTVLMIAKGIVDLHGGRLTVEQPGGRGCALIVTLPAHQIYLTR